MSNKRRSTEAGGAEDYRAMPEFQSVCNVSAVPEGEGRMFVVDETELAVFRLQDEFYAVNNRCPHAGASLAHGYVEGDVVCCRIHHWRFSIRDGTYIDAEKPRYDVQSYSVRVVGEQLQVEV